MTIVGELAALSMMVSGFLIMLGIHFGYRLLYGTLILIILAPLCIGLLRGCAENVTSSLGTASCSGGPGSGLLLLILVLVAWAYLRFLLRRRRLQGLLGRPQTSMKRRVDRS